MNLTPSDEQAMVADMVRRFLADRYDGTTMARGPMSRTDWQALGELGVFALVLPEQAGGMGGDAAEIMIIAEAFGQALAITPFAEGVVLCGRALAGNDRWGDRLVQGDASVAFARGGTLTQNSVTGAVGIVRDGMAASAIILASDTGDVALIDTASRGVIRTPVRLVDGSIAADIRFDNAPAEPLAISPDDLASAITLAELAVLAELVGAMTTLLDLTVDYVRQRQQFGKPIGTFQAVQHRCAWFYTQVEQSRSLLVKAALVEPERRQRAVTVAKAYVCDAAVTVAEGAVQLHGGMGVTDELAVGRGLRRVLLLSRLYGGGIAARAALAA